MRLFDSARLRNTLAFQAPSCCLKPPDLHMRCSSWNCLVSAGHQMHECHHAWLCCSHSTLRGGVAGLLR